MKRLTFVAALLAALSGTAHAEWGLYVTHPSGSGYYLTRSFAFFDDCDKEARSVVRNARAAQAGCAEFFTDVYSAKRQAPAAPAQREAEASSGGRGRKEAAIEFRERQVEDAARAMKRGGQRVYSNGDSYVGREYKDAVRALQQERTK
jgi:hypothetical protein